MRINFQQGIIKYPHSGALQQFLSKSGSNVNLLASNGVIEVAFAHGTNNYLLTENTTVTSAWTGIPANTDVWLYWDINRQTGQRTFGATSVQPVASGTEPASPTTDLHWFNTNQKKMYVYQSGGFREVIRVFAAKVNNSTFSPLGSEPSPTQFGGSQVGLTNISTVVGRILFDEFGNPVRKTTGEFFTTENDFYINGSPVNAIRFEAGVAIVTANQTVAQYQVVKFTDFGVVELAGYNDVGTTALAMTVQDILIGDVGTCAIQGVVTNPYWVWTTVGAELWVSENGLLVEVDPHISNPTGYPVAHVPVGRVLSETSIIFDQGLGGRGERGPQGEEGAPGVLGSFTLNDVSDVTISSPVAGDVLTYTGVQWLNQPQGTILEGNLIGITGTLDKTISVKHITIDETALVKSIRLDPNDTSPTTAGTECVLIGADAGLSATIGSYNIMLGSSVGETATTGDSNILVGTEVALGKTVGNENIIVGTSSGTESGDRNVYVGVGAASGAGASTIFTALNTVVGANAARKASSGDGNTIVGALAGTILPAPNTYTVHDLGVDNVVVGRSAYSAINSSVATQNVVLGAYAGNGITTGSRNLMLGSYAGKNLTSGSNNIIIGWSAGGEEASDASGLLSNQFIVNNENARNPASKPPFMHGDMAADTLTVNALITMPFAPTTGNHLANKAYVDSVSGGANALDDLTDVDLTTTPPVLNNVLSYDGVKWVPVVPSGGGASSLDDLTDVDVTTTPPVLNDLLVFDGAEWVNAALTSIDGGVIVGGGGGNEQLPNNTIFVFNGSGSFTPTLIFNFA